ncbi:MAG TPA: delta-lactam-biosynthetic de-N-acetylase [Pseudobacteroides sp.]|nr:delta-lactam-biosynthetic de-N-acetylase [Pseudobacteroides sp.]
MIISGGCGKAPDAANLSDLGGVYSDNWEKIDFENEITGNMPEDISVGITGWPKYELSQEDGSKLSNKPMSWGILRNPNNEPPTANPGTPELLQKYGGYYIGDTSKKEIYLTFDEGYENGYTAKILDVLRDNNVKAVFFITGPYLKNHQDLVRRMVEEGHEVGNHTINHPSLPEVDDKRLEEEILGLDRVFYEKFGKHMTYLRPPKGEFSERTLSISQKLGYTNLFWSFAYEDWHKDRVRGPEYAKNIVLRNLHNGEIMLLHAVSKDNADALDSIIKSVRELGYEFGDINNLINNKKSSIIS